MAVPAPLPTEADLRAALAETNVLEVLDQLDRELIALAPVKQRIREIAALLLIDKLRAEVGLASERPSLHMSFTGNPGTGKTTVAMKMAEVLHRLGYIEKAQVVACTRTRIAWTTSSIRTPVSARASPITSTSRITSSTS